MENVEQEVFVHPKAIVEDGATVGPGTRVWAFSHILPGAVIGAGCNICDHTFIENDVIVGDRVTIKCGVYLWDGLRLEDDVFVGPCVAFTNDKFPRSRQRPDAFLTTVVEQGASIGANATILPGLRIGRKAMVGSGSVVTKDVPPNAIVFGNPAQIVGYSDTPTLATSGVDASTDVSVSRVRGVTLHILKHVEDIRGDLCVADWKSDVPFVPKRIFCVYNVPSSRVRGEHAHKECHQFLVCTHGAVSVVVDDGVNRAEYRLDRPWIGLYLPPGIWGSQYKYSPDAVLMVLASHEYDPDDYIRDYNEFVASRRS